MPTPRQTVVLCLTAGTLALLLAACAGDAGDWKSAQQADTQEAYDAFLAKHADSKFAPQARERAAQLVEQRDWATATQADTPEAYQAFIAQHADGKWTQEARIRVENFNVLAAAAPDAPAGAASTAPAPAPAPAVAAPVAAATAKVAAAPVAAAAPPAAAPAATPKPLPVAARTPAPVPASARAAAPTPAARAGTAAAPAAATAAPSGASSAGIRVQLGAFSSVDKAEAEWSRARGKFPALQALEPRITPAETKAGRLFRLQAGVADAAAAQQLCDSLKAASQPCLVVPAK